MRRWLKKPLTHFLVIGSVLFLGNSIWQKHVRSQAPIVKKDLVISKTQIEQFKKDVYVQTGLRPTTQQLDHLIQLAIDEEVLYREALALKLDQNNPSVRQRLIDLAKISESAKNLSEDDLYQKALDLGLDRHDPVIRRLLISTMRLIAKKIPTEQAPAFVATEDMETYLQTHADLFLKPAQLKFKHLYFSRDKRGAKGKEAAEKTLKLLAQGKPAQDLSDAGDTFLAGHDFSGMTPTSLERIFGPNFVAGLKQSATGQWSGPLTSSYGWHLVLIETVQPERMATVSEAANQIKSAILRERETLRLSQTLQKLRARYQIVIENTQTEGEPHA